MRVAVVDIGSNSTRLLIADVDPASGAVEEVLRRSEVTRLGEGLDASGSLAEHAIERVMSTLADYRGAIRSHAVSVNLALLTAAVREAANGEAFAARVRDEGFLVNSACPGFVNTDMGGQFGAKKSVEDGASGVVWLATLPDDGPSGGFFRDGKPIAF